MRSKLFACLAVMILCSVTVAFVPETNAAYPEKPFEFVSHSEPGGGSDMFLRSMALCLEKEGIVKQRIRVVNRTGGSGTGCMDYLASKRGDPYVVSAINAVPLSSVIRKISILKYEDITLLAMMIMDASLIYAKYDAPYNDMKEMVAHFKKSGKEVNVSTGGLGGMSHIGAYRAGKATGLKFNIISFKSSLCPTGINKVELIRENDTYKVILNGKTIQENMSKPFSPAIGLTTINAMVYFHSVTLQKIK